jgi:hypothetical protein
MTRAQDNNLPGRSYALSGAPGESPCPRCGHPNPAGTGQCESCRTFLPGNKLSVGVRRTHGATKGIALLEATDAAMEAIVEALGDGPGSEPRYAVARYSAARALARMRLLEDFLSLRGLLDSKGRPRPASKLLSEAHGALLKHLDALGLTPMAASRLGLDLTRAKAVDIRAELAKGEALARAAEERLKR